jgi:photosystem I reaction center subunit XII
MIFISFNLISIFTQTHLSLTNFYSLESKKYINLNNKKLREYNMIYDSQVYTALVIAVVASVLAIRLGATLYS